MNMRLRNGLCADQNWFGRLCGLRLLFFQAADQDSIPLPAGVTVAVAGVFLLAAVQNCFVAGIFMLMVFRDLANQYGLAVTAGLVAVGVALLFATDQNGCIAVITVSVIVAVF